MSALSRAAVQMEQTNAHARVLGLTDSDVRAAIEKANDGRFDHLEEVDYWSGIRKLLTQQAATPSRSETSR